MLRINVVWTYSKAVEGGSEIILNGGGGDREDARKSSWGEGEEGGRVRRGGGCWGEKHGCFVVCSQIQLYRQSCLRG